MGVEPETIMGSRETITAQEWQNGRSRSETRNVPNGHNGHAYKREVSPARSRCPVPGKSRHCHEYSGMWWTSATKLRYSTTVTCTDGRGWSSPGGLYTSGLLAGHSSGA